MTLQWSRSGWTVTGIANYVGSYNMTDPSLGITDCIAGVNANNGQRWTDVDPPDQYCKAKSFWYASLNVQWQINKQLMVQPVPISSTRSLRWI